MKTYICNICKKRGKHFSGTRKMVRGHLREEHRIKGKSKLRMVLGKTTSQLTKNTIAVELE